MNNYGWAEKKAHEQLTRQGYRVYRSGWPDFLAVEARTEKVRLIEVKSHRANFGREPLLASQIQMHEIIKKHLNLEVEVLWVSDTIDTPWTRWGEQELIDNLLGRRSTIPRSVLEKYIEQNHYYKIS